jgi:small subunit ribosomal protein S6
MIYEIMTVIPGRFADTEIEKVTGDVQKEIEKAEGKIEKVLNLGKQKLAYTIGGERYGTYVIFFTSAEKAAMAKIDMNLRLSEEVLRHITIARPEGIPTGAYKLVSYVAPLTAEGRRSSERDDRPDRPAREHHEAAAPVKKMSTEELSSKLDQILDSDIMKNV